MKQKLKTTLKWVILYPTVIFLCLEIAFRILGYDSFHNDDYSIKSSPINAYVGHSELGIQLNPGKFKITLNDKVKFIAHHENGNHRFVPGNSNPDSPDVLFLGCSFTYGYGVNDDENFPSLIQKEFPLTSVRNAGVIGYGTVQSLMQLKDAIKKESVKTVLLNFSSFHFMRNNLSPAYRSNLKIGYQRSSSEVDNQMKNARFPYKASCDSEIEFQPWETMYSNWTGREWFAAINWMQSGYDSSNEDVEGQVEITACIINEMVQLCENNEISFGVICLDSSPETKLLQKRLTDVNWLDINFNFKSKKYTNLPYDSHPNKKGHQLIAKRIKLFLIGRLNEN